MPHRRFVDDLGRTWEAWDVVPSSSEGATLPARLRLGWLVFKTSSERRRLCPPPRNWTSLSEEELRAVLEKAAPRLSQRDD